jgi:hypothetical protein
MRLSVVPRLRLGVETRKLSQFGILDVAVTTGRRGCLRALAIAGTVAARERIDRVRSYSSNCP